MDKQITKPGNERQFLMVTLILGENQCQKCVRIAKELGILGAIVTPGRGTVKSAVLNLLGIKSQKKEVVNVLVEKSRAEEALDYFDKQLQLKEPGHGIAFTTSAAAAGWVIENIMQDEDDAQETEGESMFKKMTVVVNRGMAEDVMDIAHKSGVRGGTIMHGRGTGPETAAKLLGMEIEPEKELVMILMPAELVDKVAGDLYKELRLDLPGNGILFVEPVAEVRGLFEPRRENEGD